jgi:hypothetical protein
LTPFFPSSPGYVYPYRFDHADVLKDDKLDDAFLRNPAELIAGDMMIANLKKRIHWLNKACAQVQYTLYTYILASRQAGRVTQRIFVVMVFLLYRWYVYRLDKI